MKAKKIFAGMAIVIAAGTGIAFAVDPLDDYSYASDEAKLIIYLAKQEENKADSIWNANPYVQQVKNADGTLNLEKVRALLSERGIMTPIEFDATLATLRAKNYVDDRDLKARAKATQMKDKLFSEKISKDQLIQETAALEALQPTTTPESFF